MDIQMCACGHHVTQHDVARAGVPCLICGACPGFACERTDPGIQAVTARYAHRKVSTVALGGMTVDAWLCANGMPPLGSPGMVVKCWAWDSTLDSWLPVLSPQHAAAQRRVAAEMAGEDL